MPGSLKITGIADGALTPPRLDAAALRAYQEMMRCLSPETGPVLAASTFLGSGGAGGGGYAGHAEIYDMDGLLRDIYQQPSMEAGVNDTLFGGGKGFSLAPTLLSTVGEAIERVVAGLVGCSPHLPGRRLVATFEELSSAGEPALDPQRLGLFSDAQYATEHFLYARFSRDTRVQWLLGERLISGAPVWVPAQLVDMVHLYDPGEELVGYPVSGGLSCHASRTAAVYHGLTEVIERDAVNRSWYCDPPPRRVRLDDPARRVLGGFADRLELDHSAGYLLLHDTDVCSAPTFSVVGLQDWLPRRRYCAGGACDVVPATALRKAAAEFGQTRSTLALSVVAPGSAVGRSVRTMFDWQVGRPLAEMTLFFQAIGYYGLPEYEPLLEHYLSGDEVGFDEIVERAALTDPAAPLEERFRALLDELASAAIDPIVLDYSHPCWRDLSVVKVYVPSLTAPFLQSRPMLGHPRLADLRPTVIADDGTVLPLPYP